MQMQKPAPDDAIVLLPRRRRPLERTDARGLARNPIFALGIGLGSVGSPNFAPIGRDGFADSPNGGPVSFSRSF